MSVHSLFERHRWAALLKTRSGSQMEKVSPFSDPNWDGWYCAAQNGVELVAIAIPDGLSIGDVAQKLMTNGVYLWDDVAFDVVNVSEAAFSDWAIAEGMAQSIDVDGPDD